MRTAFGALKESYLGHGESLTGALQCHVGQASRVCKRRRLNNSAVSRCPDRTGESPVPRGLWYRQKRRPLRPPLKVRSRLEPITPSSVRPHFGLAAIGV